MINQNVVDLYNKFNEERSLTPKMELGSEPGKQVDLAAYVAGEKGENLDQKEKVK